MSGDLLNGTTVLSDYAATEAQRRKGALPSPGTASQPVVPGPTQDTYVSSPPDSKRLSALKLSADAWWPFVHDVNKGQSIANNYFSYEQVSGIFLRFANDEDISNPRFEFVNDQAALRYSLASGHELFNLIEKTPDNSEIPKPIVINPVTSEEDFNLRYPDLSLRKEVEVLDLSSASSGFEVQERVAKRYQKILNGFNDLILATQTMGKGKSIRGLWSWAERETKALGQLAEQLENSEGLLSKEALSKLRKISDRVRLFYWKSIDHREYPAEEQQKDFESITAEIKSLAGTFSNLQFEPINRRFAPMEEESNDSDTQARNGLPALDFEEAQRRFQSMEFDPRDGSNTELETLRYMQMLALILDPVLNKVADKDEQGRELAGEILDQMSRIYKTMRGGRDTRMDMLQAVIDLRGFATALHNNYPVDQPLNVETYRWNRDEIGPLQDRIKDLIESRMREEEEKAK